MSEPSSSDEFDMFLQESEKKVGKSDELALIRVKVDDIVQHALDNLGYTALDENEDRADRERDQYKLQFEDYVRRRHPDESFDDRIDLVLDGWYVEKIIFERYIIASLKLHLARNLLKGSEANENDAKRKFLARMFVSRNLSDTDILWGVINLLLPGDTVNLGDGSMEQPIKDAYTQKEHDDRQAKLNHEFVDQALVYAGVSLEDTSLEAAACREAASRMRFLASLYDYSDAEREQALRNNAREELINSNIASKLTDFFIRHKEPKL